MQKSYFGSDQVITQHISEADLKAYIVGYDFGEYRYDPLTSKIISAVVDFAFGYHEGILENYTLEELKNAARMVYKIDDYDPNNPKHMKTSKGKKVAYIDEEDFLNSRYYNRGEFGELILHLLLRDFIGTIPLLSKIYLRDAYGTTIKGLDAVHIGPDLTDNTLESIYFGESKLQGSGEVGITELIKDIKDHFNRDFLNGEFLLIGNKKNNFIPIDEYADKNSKMKYIDFLEKKNHWYSQLREVQRGHIKMQDLFKSVTIPMLCTYTSKVLSSHSDETSDLFEKEITNEIEKLKKIFLDKLEKLKTQVKDSGPITTNLNVILMLFPVPDKKELVKRLHEKLYHQQRI